MHPDDARDSRLDDATTVVAILLLALAAIVLTAAALLPADPAHVAPDVARDFLPFDAAVRPEPSERLIFMLCALLLPLLAAAGAWQVGRHHSAAWAQAARGYAVGAGLLAASAFGNAHGTRRMFRLDNPGAMLVAGGLSLALAYWFLARAPLAAGKVESRTRRGAWMPFIFIATLLVPAVAWRPLPLAALQSSFRHYANLDVVVSPVIQAAHGRLPLVDFTSQYGLYATFLAPLTQVFGFTIASLTITLVALQLLATVALIVVVLRECQSRVLAVLAVAGIVFVSGGYVPARFDPDPYLQYWPIRFFWPALMTLLVQQWVRSARRPWLALTSLAGGIAILWNLDSGIAAAGAWLGLLFTRAVTATITSRGHSQWRELGTATALLLVPLLVFATALSVRAESPVDYRVMLESHARFYVTGFFMVPLPRSLHPWQVIAAAYVAAMVIGMAHALGRINNPRAVLIHYLAFLGVGLFAYYQGRSVDQVLMAVSWPALMIVFLGADWMRTRRGTRRDQRRTGDLLIVGAVALGSWCAVVLTGDAPAALRMAVRNWTAQAPTPVTRNVDFMRVQAHPGQPQVVISRFQATYAAETGLPSALHGHAVGESVARSMGRAHVREIESIRPERLFVGVPYREDSDRNPYVDLLPVLARDYRLAGTTTGAEELRVYIRR
jgi:hypothetical protein